MPSIPGMETTSWNSVVEPIDTEIVHRILVKFFLVCMYTETSGRAPPYGLAFSDHWNWFQSSHV